MNKKASIKLLNLIGAVFLVWGIIAVITSVVYSDEGVAPVLWMSYICLIILGIGVITKNPTLVASQITIIGIPYIIWNIDFFHHYFTGTELFGITNYFFKDIPTIEKIIASQHIFNLPLSLYALHLIGLKNKGFWKISLFQITVVFFITRAVTDYEKNVNCVYRNCANFTFGLPHIYEWFVSYIILIALTSWFLIKIFKKK